MYAFYTRLDKDYFFRFETNPIIEDYILFGEC